MKKKVLIVEDETIVAEVLSDNLEEEGYEVRWACDGEEAIEIWKRWRPDLVLLDVMLPKRDGFSVCEAMREDGDLAPVLFLSAKGRPEDRVQGLLSGGDDYLVKPFHLPELLLRVQNMLRRLQMVPESSETTNLLRFGGHEVDVERGEVRLKNGQVRSLQGKSLELLVFFVEHAGQTLERDVLLDQVWSDGVFPSTRVVERHLEQLRKLFESNPEQPLFFPRLRGARYRFVKEPK